MTKTRSTKSALISSVLALFLCFAMLLGTTFAWFTDSATSANNIIQSGNLDVVLEYKTAWDDEWAPVNAGTLLFNNQALYEPGYTEIIFLRVSNAGSLALKFNMMFNLKNEVPATNVEGDEFKLSDYLQFGSYQMSEYNGEHNYADILMPIMFGTREAALQNANMVTMSAADPMLATGAPVEAGDKTAQVFALVLSMPTIVGNEVNTMPGTEAPSFEFGVSLVATQLVSESDSFGNNYDSEASLPDVVGAADELAAALRADEKNISVTLSGDVDLPMSSLGSQTPGSGEYKLGGAQTETIEINLNGHKLNLTTSYMSAIGAVNPDAMIIIKDGTMTSTGNKSTTWNIYDVILSNCNYVIENVKFEKSLCLNNTGKNATLKNVTITEAKDLYALWIPAEGQTVEIDGLTINGGRGIKIDEQYANENVAKVTLKVSNATFDTNKKAAILVKSVKGADITLNNVNIANTVDPIHAVWVDEDSAAYANLVTVTGAEMANEGEVAVDKADLQSKLNKATGTAYIELVNDIVGDVTATQKPDVKVTIEGNGKTFAGVLLVDGKSGTYTTAGLTIQNVKFVAESISADACIQLGDGTNATRYTCNVTVSGCTFDVPGAVGVKSYTGGDKNLTISDCTATARAHSLVQAKGIDGILVENCEVYSKNGLNFNNSTNVTVEGCTVDVKGYAVRFGESSGGEGAAEVYLIKNCSLKSANDDGDATIILRGTADNSTLTIENTTIVGTPDIKNTATNATVIK